MHYAIIDIGTNTLILLIVKKTKKGFEVICDKAIITRLGQAVSENHFLMPEAMKRTQNALAEFKAECAKYEVEKILAVGTAAFRNSANAKVFVDKIKKELKLSIQIISGEEEADYVFGAAYEDFGKEGNLIVVDIGGGSTEIITGPIKGKTKSETEISLPYGSVKLTEQYIHSDPVSDSDLLRLIQGIRNGIRDNLDGLYAEDFNPSTATLVATAGTATTLATLCQGLKSYDADLVHGSKITKEQLATIIEILARKNIKERQKIPGLDPLRADVILSGGILLSEIMSYFKKTEVVISDRGLRYGVLYKKLLK